VQTVYNVKLETKRYYVYESDTGSWKYKHRGGRDATKG
jgi:hypothetical protein